MMGRTGIMMCDVTVAEAYDIGNGEYDIELPPCTFKKGDPVQILAEFIEDERKIYVIFSRINNESTTVLSRIVDIASRQGEGIH